MAVTAHKTGDSQPGTLRQEKALDRYSRVLAWSAGAGMLLAAGLIGLDVTLRLLFNRSIEGTVEISGYILAIGSAWAFAYALVTKAHVRVDTVYMLLPARIRPWLDLLALLSLGFLIGVLCYRAGELAAFSFQYKSRSPSQFPLWVPQGLWAFGLVFFFSSIVNLAVRLIAALLRGDVDQAASLVSVESVETEIRDEILDLEQRRIKV